MDPATGAIIGGAAIGAAGNYFGGQAAASATSTANRMNLEWAKDMAHHGIRYRAMDARAAGLNPLAAMGANISAGSPVVTPNTAEGEAMANMGQDIGRAFYQTRNADEKKLATLQVASAEQDVLGKSLENDMKLMELQKMGTSQPAFPGGQNFIPGQGNSGGINMKPADRVIGVDGHPEQEGGQNPEVAYARTNRGLVPVMPKELAESLESDFFGGIDWAVRNRVAPLLGGQSGKPSNDRLNYMGDWKYKGTQWEPDYKYTEGKNGYKKYIRKGR